MAKLYTFLLPQLLFAVSRGDLREDDRSLYQDNLEMVTTLKGFSHAVECMGNIVQESLRSQSENRDVCRESLEMQKESRDSLMGLGKLTDLVETFSIENEQLKNQLASEVKMVQVLQGQLNQSTRQVETLSEHELFLNNSVAKLQVIVTTTMKENYLYILKIQDLEQRLATAVKENEKNVLKVQEMDAKLIASQGRIEELTEKIKLLNHTVNSTNRTTEQRCQLPGGTKIWNAMQEYNRTKKWETAKKSLEEALDHDSEANKQLQELQYHSPLYWIGRKGNMELAEVLVTCGGAVDVADNEGRTMLYGAALSGEVKIAGWLVDHGADLEAGYRGGWTPLMNAAGVGQLEFVKYLVRVGASTTTRNSAGQTALDWARKNRHDYVAVYLSGLPH